jgi:23S rRNA 5-hydroxycytidine C2501 synthase
MTESRRIELLAPARNLACGLAAIDHGADAVYIGGPAFSARAAAANSLADLEKLVKAAHRFGVRIYVALNTILTDRELPQAVKLTWQLGEVGVDALIIQDMGLLECSLPPVALHASTQCDNRSPEKVRFLEEVGFRQVVLARELSLEQIRRIRKATSVTLEVFVHGALCVSYSGRCYISEVVAGRSANRGECAQFCRHRYTLRHPRGEVLMADRHLLSLKDLDLSAHLASLLSAGVDSFKIEGRLKDENYVKNVTAAYRRALDALLDADDGLRPGSSGNCQFSFIPDTSRTFHRGKTDYFLVNRRNTPGAPDTPKAIGQPLGRVREVGRDYLALDAVEEVHNGDGLCYIDGQGKLVGIKVNRVTADRIYPRDRPSLPPGTMVYRNLDTAFLAELARSSGCRKLSVRLQLTAVAEGLQLMVCDEDGVVSTATLETSPQPAKSSADLSETAIRQLRKIGGTPFVVGEVKVELPAGVYYAGRLFNELRRQALENHLERRLEEYRVEKTVIAGNDFPWPETSLGYSDNIANHQALAFYRRHGVSTITEEGLEAAQAKACQLMTCKYCLRAQLSLCPRLTGQGAGNAEPLLLADDAGEYLLTFLCDRCEMTVQRYGRKGTKGR